MHEPVTRVNEYKIQDKDDSGPIRYYGYMNEIGTWYIMRWDTINDTFRYFKSFVGRSPYSKAWAERATAIYSYWSDSF